MIIEKPFKILSIDGGGIKGLFSAEVLKSIEEQFDHPVSEYFDMICGTSTGGLIALSLSLNIPAYEIVEFYKNEGPKIFPNKTQLSRRLAFCRQLFWRAKYSNKELQRALVNIFGDRKMEDSNSLLCIPSYNLTAGRPKVFKSPLIINGENKWPYDAGLKMKDVALATSAAPTYFPVYQIGNEYFTDGGVWCNNPAICGLTEAFCYFLNKEFAIDNAIVKYTSIQILSISSVNQPNSWSSKRKKDRSALKWLSGNKLLQPFMEGQSYFTDHFIKTLIKSNGSLGLNIHYKRISHPNLSVEKINNVDLDKATRSAIADLSILGIDEGRFLKSSKKHEIQDFFNSYKSFKNS